MLHTVSCATESNFNTKQDVFLNRTNCCLLTTVRKFIICRNMWAVSQQASLWKSECCIFIIANLTNMPNWCYREINSQSLKLGRCRVGEHTLKLQGAGEPGGWHQMTILVVKTQKLQQTLVSWRKVLCVNLNLHRSWYLGALPEKEHKYGSW